MKIFRWMLSHTLLILVIITVIYGYMFWGNLAGENTPAGKAVAYLSKEFVVIDEFVSAIKDKQAKLNQNESAEQLATVQSTQEQKLSGLNGEAQSQDFVANVDSSEDDLVSKDRDAVDRDIEQQPVTISYSHNQVQITQSSAGDIKKESKDVASSEIHDDANLENVSEDVDTPDLKSSETIAKIAPSGVIVVESSSAGQDDVKETFVSEDIAQRLDSVDDRGRVIDSAQRNAALRENWIIARKSFYQRNYVLSEQSYQKVIAASQDNFDAYGELGNVYFNQGKNKQAASAYYEAAAIFVRNGQLNRAKSLMGLLQRLDIAKARELQKLINSPMS